MIDIHSHVLWHLDDGASDFDVSLGLCEIAADSGISVLTATPHLMYWEDVDILLERRERKLDTLSDALRHREIPLKLAPGFEILCDDDIFDIKHFAPFTINGSRYILIEFDFRKTTEEDVSSWCDYLISFGLVPIIAHPERYGFILDDPGAAERLGRKNILFQQNCGSAIGMFGEREARLAIRMLNSGYCDFLGSDAHSLRSRNTDLSRMLRHYPDTVSDDVIKTALEDNPDTVLRDGIIAFPQRSRL